MRSDSEKDEEQYEGDSDVDDTFNEIQHQDPEDFDETQRQKMTQMYICTRSLIGCIYP